MRDRRHITIAVALALLLALPSPAAARFSVGPSVEELRLRPGQAGAGSFAVNLRGERRTRFVVELQDVGQAPGGEFDYGRPGRSRFSASRWIAYAPRAFAGAPSRVQPVEYRVRVPEDAEPGDHVASLTLKRLPRDDVGVTSVQAVSVRLTVRVAGERREAVAIEALEVPAIAGRGPVRISTVLRNTGNVRLDFDRGNDARLSMLGGAQVRLRGQLLPGELRAVELAVDDPPATGRLTARASVRTRGGTVARETSFWMVPWRQGGALLLVGLATVAIATGRRRRPAADGP